MKILLITLAVIMAFIVGVVDIPIGLKILIGIALGLGLFILIELLPENL